METTSITTIYPDKKSTKIRSQTSEALLGAPFLEGLSKIRIKDESCRGKSEVSSNLSNDSDVIKNVIMVSQNENCYHSSFRNRNTLFKKNPKWSYIYNKPYPYFTISFDSNIILH